MLVGGKDGSMNGSEEKELKYLNSIHSPQDLKDLPEDVMPELADEIRSELVNIVSRTGGHLASNLGVVELTMAIHRVFNCPHDHIIFDVGHQSYVHKMLTGRYDAMQTLRQPGGISGFTNRFESEYDCFGAGHSSTSLSAALGFAMSDKIQKSDAYTVVVVGDGAYTGGMIHEALNNCRKNLNLIIIMNENEMSISKNIGRFARNLAKLRARPAYFRTKKATGAFLRHIPLVGHAMFRVVRGVKKSFKNVLYGSNYFESMGLTYLGPIDGNDYYAVENLLREAVKLEESVVLHLKTVKGKGYPPAEDAPDLYHGMSPQCAVVSSAPNFSRVMGEERNRLAEQDPKICAVTAARCDGTGLQDFRAMLPERFFDVGIAEEHALTFAAGLAANHMVPVVAIYSTFLQRGYDNILHDIALQKLPVVLCVDRAGLNPGDGATHHGIFDVAFLSQIPGMKIYTPVTADTLRTALREAVTGGQMCAIRYSNCPENPDVVRMFYSQGAPDTLGVRSSFGPEDSPELVIVTHGRIVKEAMKATDILNRQGIPTGILLCEVLKPYDRTAEEIHRLLPQSVKGVIFLEEEIRSGGAGMNLADQMIRQGYLVPGQERIMAVDDSFVTGLKPGQTVYDAAGISAEHIVNQAIELGGMMRGKLF